MINLFNFILSIIYVFVVIETLSKLFGYSIFSKLLSKIKIMQKINSDSFLKDSVFMIFIFLYFIMFGFVKNYARSNLLISIIILIFSGIIALLLLKFKKLNWNRINKLRNSFFVICLFSLSYNIFSYPEIFSIAKSGTFDIISLLIIGFISILSGFIISVDIFYNFLKNSDKLLNTNKYNKILFIIILNFLILLLSTEAVFVCNILLILGFVLGISANKNIYGIDKNKVQITIDFFVFILICFISIFIGNIFLTIISSIIAGSIFRNNIQDIKDVVLVNLNEF